MALLGLVTIGLVITGIVLGWVAFFRVSRLEKQVMELSRRLASPPAEAHAPAPSAPQPAPPPDTRPPPEFDLPLPFDADGEPATDTVPGGTATEPPPEGRSTPGLAASWRNQWMTWMGGLCVALAGVFMVRYGIEQGLLGPAGRVTLGLVSGLALHGAAEWLVRRRGPHPAFAALAGGASITLFASLLAALHLYGLLAANLVFLVLAVISLLTMVLALRQGPLLAAIGLLGGYLVPLLVSTGSGNIAAAMVYALIISGSGLALMRFVPRTWLWWGVMAGTLGWWLIALARGEAGDFQGLYLAIACYGVLALPRFDWTLANREGDGASPTDRLLFPSLFLLTAAWALSLLQGAGQPLSALHWGPLVAVLGLAMANRPALWAPGWLSLVLAAAATVGAQLHYSTDTHWRLTPLATDESTAFHYFALHMAVLYSALSLLALRNRPFSHGAFSLLCLSPLVWLATAYLLTGDLSGSWQWSLATLAFGLVYVVFSGYQISRDDGGGTPWLVLSSHLAWSLAAAMYFREAGLTLALAVQLVTLAGLLRRHDLPWLPWLIKGVIAIVVARLTFNPWLASYPADVHWSLWTGAGSTLCCIIAAWLVGTGHPIRRWLEAAGLHLLVLTLGAEVRYQLYDGQIFVHRYGLTEAAINSCLWAGLGIAYYVRAGASASLTSLYRCASLILLTMALASYLLSVTVLNPLWSHQPVSSRPVFNLLLLAYGLPVVLAALVSWLHRPPLRKVAALVAGLGALLFVSLEIRHLWQGHLHLHLATGNGELYTYSAVWLAIAVGCLLAGALRGIAVLNRYGFALLGLVIGKIFLVDLGGLEGLLRVASFMGLGLSLLALAYLRSRLADPARG